MIDSHHFIRIDFHNFKAFRSFAINLRHMNILVGPNNAGKSTILAAFRILASALRKSLSKKPEYVPGPRGTTLGYVIDLNGMSVAEENIFYNYDDSESASVVFRLSNRNSLTLYFPELGICYLIADAETGPPRTPTTFRNNFNCSIGFVPILGPVDHKEQLYREEAARLALYNYTASRNFRNIWHYYPDKFKEFRGLLQETWPGMDIEPPTVDYSHDKPFLHMFCPEDRIPREIYWAGFGFQVWCQMLTHLVQSTTKTLFLIDEPDIYLHSDLQRQLLGLLRNLGPDILIATHSTEIICEAEADDIVLIDKKQKSARRIAHPSDLTDVFTMLGSNLNPVLTLLAKTRHVVFVEGKDFQVISKFARKLNQHRVANRSDFAIVPVEGFNPERIRTLIKGMETTLGGSIKAAAVLDRDYRSQKECDAIIESCRKTCSIAMIHGCKEIENHLLVSNAIDLAADRRVADRSRRTGNDIKYKPCVEEELEKYILEMKNFVASRYLAMRRQFEKYHSPGKDETSFNEETLIEFERLWADKSTRVKLIPGKDALSRINQVLQKRYIVSVTHTAIISAMRMEDIPTGMRELVESISEFSTT